MKNRNLTKSEKALIVAMIDNSNSKWAALKANLDSALVSEMKDGGMGSLKFESGDSYHRRLGSRVNEAEFNDSDGVLVSVVLNLDQHGDLFELDIWKVNFDRLLKIPNPEQLRFINQV